MTMTVPTFTRQKVVDDSGYFTPQMQQFFDQLVSSLGSNFNEQGIIVPNVAAETVAQLSKSGNGNMLYVPDPTNPANDKVKILMNGTYKTFTVT